MPQIKDTRKENGHGHNGQTNMDITVIDILNQLFVRVSYSVIKFSKKYS